MTLKTEERGNPSVPPPLSSGNTRFEKAPYLRNCWYVAALSSEVSADRAIERTLLGHSVALYRDSNRSVAILGNRCPHRFAQLHMGQVQGDLLECPYHGLRFDRTGNCVHNPHGDGVIPKRATVQSFPVIEYGGLVWFWPGDNQKADQATLPDLSSLQCDEPNAIVTGYMHTSAHYELVTDNLMDLSHADYIHRESLNTSGSLSKMRPKVKAHENSVNAFWSYETDSVQPFFRGTMRNPDGRAHQSFDITWHPASCILLHVTARDADLTPDDDAIYTTAHLLTPETERSCHYFVVGKRDWDLGNAVLNEALKAGILGAFIAEDKPALEAVQESMGDETDIWSLDPVILSCDPGPVHVRRMLQRLIKQERATDLEAMAS